MISQLHIENIAVIEKADINFKSGFNVFTGETGAGKSILIGSINAVLGERISRDMIRSGCESAVVSAVFECLPTTVVDKLQEYGIDCDDDVLIVQRNMSSDGKSSCRINGRTTTVSMLKEISKLMINVHGQHDNQSLLSPETHVDYIDALGKLENDIAEYKAIYSELCYSKKQLRDISINTEDRANKLDLLSYQIHEIEESELYEGEEEELISEKKRIANSKRITDALFSAYTALEGTEDGEGIGALELIRDAASSLEDIDEYTEDFKDTSEKIWNLLYELEEHKSDIFGSIDNYGFDQNRLDEIESRLDVLFRLKKKYGSSVSEIISFYNAALLEYEQLQNIDINTTIIRERIDKLQSKAKHIAEAISAKRKLVAEEFTKKVKAELEFLNMPSVNFLASFNSCELNENGCDVVEFLISTNAGEPEKPLHKIASGGELSRIMLAIKNVLADKDNIDTLIFDEIDSGVSGRAALKIGMKLKEVSRGRQIICVTHLAQIAAYADEHMLIEKNTHENRTITTITQLDFEGRKNELARIISGMDATDLSLRNAHEMLDYAKNTII